MQAVPGLKISGGLFVHKASSTRLLRDVTVGFWAVEFRHSGLGFRAEGFGRAVYLEHHRT